MASGIGINHGGSQAIISDNLDSTVSRWTETTESSGVFEMLPS